MNRLRYLLIAYLAFCTTFSFAQNIETIVGNGTRLISGDGGAASLATVSRSINSIVEDKWGNVYFTDSAYIRKIDTNGIITRYAGSGRYIDTFNGYGIPATDANISPTHINVDNFGNLIFNNGYQSVVSIITTDGIINRLIGNGRSDVSPDGASGTNISIGGANIVRIDLHGNLYFAEGSNGRIRKINSSGVISTIAGKDTAGYSGDGGPATNAKFGTYVKDLVIDSSGNIIIHDWDNSRFRKISHDGIVTTIGGHGDCSSTTFIDRMDGHPATDAIIGCSNSFMAIDKYGNIYYTEAFSDKVRKIDTGGIVHTLINKNAIRGFSGDGGPATAAAMHQPCALGVSSNGSELWVADLLNYRIRKVTYPAPRDTTSGGDTIINDSTTYVVQANATKWMIAPNPAENGVFTIAAPTNATGIYDVTILDVVGRLVEKTELTTTKPQKFKINGPPGTYQVVISDGVSKQFYKLVVQ